MPHIAAVGTILKVSSMTQCGTDSDPTPPRQLAGTLIDLC